MQLVNVAKWFPIFNGAQCIVCSICWKTGAIQCEMWQERIPGLFSFNLVMTSALTLLTVVFPSMATAHRLSKSIFLFFSNTSGSDVTICSAVAPGSCDKERKCVSDKPETALSSWIYAIRFSSTAISKYQYESLSEDGTLFSLYLITKVNIGLKIFHVAYSQQ